MRHGFIREEKQIKYLILFSMSFLPIAIEESDLLDIVLIDDAFGYFEFSQAFSDLCAQKHIATVEVGGTKLYAITPDGHAIITELMDELPFSIRDKAQKAAMRVLLKIRRQSSIKTAHEENDDGTYAVTLRICDKETEHFALRMRMVNARQCAIIEEHFRRNADRIYKEVLGLLSDTPPAKQ